MSNIPPQDSIWFDKKLNHIGDSYEKNLLFHKKELLAGLELLSKKSNPFLISKVDYLLGKIYIREAKYDSARFYLFESLDYREKYPAYQGTTHEALAELYLIEGEHHIALSHLYKSLEIKEKIGNNDFLKSLYNTLGNTHYFLDDLDSSLYYYNSSLQIMLEENDTHRLAALYTNIANVLYQQDYNEEAIRMYQKSYYLYDQLNRISESATPLFNIASVHSWLDNTDSAFYYYRKSLERMTVGGNYQNLDEVYHAMAEDYARLDLLDSSILMFKEYIVYRDSVFSIEKTKAIADAEIKYQTKENQQLLKLKKTENEKISIQSRNKTVTIVFLFTVLAGIIILILILVRNFAQKKRLDQLEINAKNQEIDHLLKEQEAKSYAALIEGQNTERKRIAQDIHDRLGGSLAAVKLHFHTMDEDLANSKSRNDDQFRLVKELLDNAVNDVRRISHDLAGGRIIELGLKGALNDLSVVLNASNKISFNLIVGEKIGALSMYYEQEIYAVIQELISNTLKHAQAKSIDLQLNVIQDELNIIFEDDGIGFNYDQSAQKGLGLKGMKERLTRINGNVEYDSFPGRGTIVIINVSL